MLFEGLGQFHSEWKEEFFIFEKAPYILQFCSEFASLLYLFNICWVLHIMLNYKDNEDTVSTPKELPTDQRH